MPCRITRERSRRRTSSPWTGTTRSSRAPCVECEGKAHRRRVGATRDGRARRALRLDQRLGHRGRDGRVRASPRRARTHQSRPRSLSLHQPASPRGRRLLDRNCLPRSVTFPDRETTSYTAAAVILAADALTLVVAGRGSLSPRHVARTVRPRRTGLPAGASDAARVRVAIPWRRRRGSHFRAPPDRSRTADARRREDPRRRRE
jgi:hypothetical protein